MHLSKSVFVTMVFLSRIRATATLQFTLCRAGVAGFLFPATGKIGAHTRGPRHISRAPFSTTGPSRWSTTSRRATTAIGIENIANNPLPSSDLRWKCDPALFDFKTTEELEDLNNKGLLGQERAESAIKFGVNMHQDGYNLYVLGPSGSGKRTIVRKYLENRSMDDPCASDWAYV